MVLRDRRSAWSSPVVLAGVVYVGSFDHSVYALDAACGRELWRVATLGEVWSSPTVQDGTMLVESRRPEVVPPESFVHALDPTSGRELWRFATGGAKNASPRVVDGAVYVGGGDSEVVALDAESGAVHWRFSIGTPSGAPRGAETARPARSP